MANAQQQLQELIRQNYNHASIFTWAIGNESTQGQFNCNEPYDNVTPVLRAMHETAKAEDPSRPTWNMFDFGSAHRNEGDVLGVNTKGLMGFDHQTPKDAFYFYKANWNPEPTTYIVGRRHTDRPYPLVDVKVYSNADSVDLAVNDTPIGTMSAGQCEQRTCVFTDVPLVEAPNTVTATGNHAGTPVADTVEWRLDTSTGINIAAGRLASGYVSSQGTRFGSDNFFSGGSAGPSPRDAAAEFGLLEGASIRGTEDDPLYQYFREESSSTTSRSRTAPTR